MTELLERLSSHMQAARAAEGSWVTKSAEHYLGQLGALDTEGCERLLSYCRQHGFEAELAPGNLGGIYLRMRHKATRRRRDHGTKG